MKVEAFRDVFDAYMRVGDTGSRWFQARAEAERLEEERNGILCVNERIVTGEESWDYREGKSCWKGANTGPEGEYEHNVHPDEWCEPCKRRADLHAQWKRARRLASSLRGALTRACAKAASTAPRSKGAG